MSDRPRYVRRRAFERLRHSKIFLDFLEDVADQKLITAQEVFQTYMVGEDFTFEEAVSSIPAGSTTFPAGLLWNTTTINGTFTISNGLYSANVTPQAIVDANIFTGASFFVKGETGSDSNSGADFDNALRTIHAAITAGNATAAPYQIFLDTDELYNESSLSQNGNVQPSQNMAIRGVGSNPRAVYMSGPHESNVSWALQSGTTYQSSISAVKRVLDMSRTFDYGLPIDLEEVASIAECNETNDSFYFDNAGDIVYVNIGRDPTNRLRVLRNFNTMTNWSNAVDIFLENFEIWGGGSGCVNLNTTDTSRNVVGVNCRFMAPASANKGSSPQDTLTIQGTGGILAFFECEASLGHKDGWNFHRNAATNPTQVLLANCQGYWNGSDADSSSNCFTTHDDVTSICIGCDFAKGEIGNTVHCIQDTLSWFFDCNVVAEDVDDGSTAFKSSNASSMWIERSTADASNGSVDNFAVEANGGQVFLRDLKIIKGTTTAYSGGSIANF